MTVYFAANELGGWDFTSPAATFSTSTGYDSNYCRGAMTWTGANNGINDYLGAQLRDSTGTNISLSSLFLHYELYSPGGGMHQTGGFEWQLLNSSGTPVLQSICQGNGTTQTYIIYFWNGTAWVSTGASYSYFIQNVITFDFQIVCGASGSIKCYQGNSLVSTGTISSSATNNVSYIKMGGCANANSGGNYFSQILVKDTSTLLRKVARRTITGAGNYSQWQGAYTVLTDSNDTTWISDNGNGDRASYLTGALTITPNSSQMIEAVVVAGRMSRDSSGVQNANFFLRSSATNYEGQALPLALNLTGQMTVWNTNPATSSTWAISEANSLTLEIGVRATL